MAKTIAVLDESELHDGQLYVEISHCLNVVLIEYLRKEVDFESGKVLLSRLGDKIHATSAFCTHFGAPLAKGVLTADGRLVWCVPMISFSMAALNTVHLAPGTEVRVSLSKS